MNKLTIFLLTFLLSAGSCTAVTIVFITPPAPTLPPPLTAEDPTPTREGTQTPMPTNETNAKEYGRVTATNGLNLRTSPVILETNKQGLLTYNTLVEIDYAVTNNRPGWFYVAVLGGEHVGKSGWVSSQHILKGGTSLE